MEKLTSLESNESNQDLILELKDFYDVFLVDFIDLAMTYGYTSPLDVFNIINLVSESFDDKFEISKNIALSSSSYPSLEKRDILGVQTLLGSGVCRHKAALLSDLYNRNGKESLVLIGKSEMLLNFYYGNSINKQLHDRLFVSNILDKISQGAKIEDFKRQLKKRKISYQIKNVHDDYYLRISQNPNHAIVLVGDEKKYYLDPMNKSILFKDECDEITLKNSGGEYFFFDIKQHIVYSALLSLLDKDFIKKYKRIIELESSTEKDSKKEFIRTKTTINNDSHVAEFIKSYQPQIQNIKEKSLILKRN